MIKHAAPAPAPPAEILDPSGGANQVRVPTHLFKLVYDAATHKAWAHWQPNAPDARVSPPISYRELEQRIGLALLPGLRVQ